MTPHDNIFSGMAAWLKLREGMSADELADLHAQQNARFAEHMRRYQWQDADEPIISALEAKDLREWFKQ